MLRFLLSLLLLVSGCISGGTPEAFATISSNISKVIYNGDGTSTSFTFGSGGYSVPVYLVTDIQVYAQNVASGVITQLTLNNQYSVTLTAVPYSLSNTVVYYTAVINLAGGSSPYGALPVGTNLIINRSIPFTNLINITDYSSTPAATWNQGFDRATMLAQQLYALSQQGVLQPISATSPISLPTPLANYGLCWDSTATFLTNCTVTSGSSIPVPIPNGYLSTLTTANLVNTSSITGTLGTAHGGTGSTANANSASGVVVLNGSSQLPAVDGSLLTNTPLIKVATANPSAVSSFTISGLSAGKRYKLVLDLIQNTSTSQDAITFNSDTGNNYYSSYNGAFTALSASANIFTSNYSLPAGTSILSEILFSSGNVSHSVLVSGLSSYNTGTYIVSDSLAGYYAGSANLSSITITVGAGTMTGTAVLYQLS